MRKLMILLLMLLPVVAHAEAVMAKRVAGDRVMLQSGSGGSLRYSGSGVHPNCPLEENATVSVNFNIQNFDGEVASAKTFLTQRATEIEAISKEIGLTKFEITTMNYNLSGNMVGNQRDTLAHHGGDASSFPMNNQFSGSIRARFLPADKAMELLSALEKKRFKPSLSYNANRQPCNPND